MMKYVTFKKFFVGYFSIYKLIIFNWYLNVFLDSWNMFIIHFG